MGDTQPLADRVQQRDAAGAAGDTDHLHRAVGPLGGDERAAAGAVALVVGAPAGDPHLRVVPAGTSEAPAGGPAQAGDRGHGAVHPDGRQPGAAPRGAGREQGTLVVPAQRPAVAGGADRAVRRPVEGDHPQRVAGAADQRGAVGAGDEATLDVAGQDRTPARPAHREHVALHGLDEDAGAVGAQADAAGVEREPQRAGRAGDEVHLGGALPAGADGGEQQGGTPRRVDVAEVEVAGLPALRLQLDARPEQLVADALGREQLEGALPRVHVAVAGGPTAADAGQRPAGADLVPGHVGPSRCRAVRGRASRLDGRYGGGRDGVRRQEQGQERPEQLRDDCGHVSPWVAGRCGLVRQTRAGPGRLHPVRVAGPHPAWSSSSRSSVPVAVGPAYTNSRLRTPDLRVGEGERVACHPEGAEERGIGRPVGELEARSGREAGGRGRQRHPVGEAPPGLVGDDHQAAGSGGGQRGPGGGGRDPACRGGRHELVVDEHHVLDAHGALPGAGREAEHHVTGGRRPQHAGLVLDVGHPVDELTPRDQVGPPGAEPQVVEHLDGGRAALDRAQPGPEQAFGSGTEVVGGRPVRGQVDLQRRGGVDVQVGVAVGGDEDRVGAGQRGSEVRRGAVDRDGAPVGCEDLAIEVHRAGVRDPHVQAGRNRGAHQGDLPGTVERDGPGSPSRVATTWAPARTVCRTALDEDARLRLDAQHVGAGQVREQPRVALPYEPAEARTGSPAGSSSVNRPGGGWQHE